LVIKILHVYNFSENRMAYKTYKEVNFVALWTSRPSVTLQINSTYYITLGDRGSTVVNGCTTNRKVAFSIPDGVIGVFHWHNPSDRTMFLGSTQLLTEMSTRSKNGRRVRLTNLPESCVVTKSGNVNFLEQSGPIHACNGPATHLPFYITLTDLTN